MLLANKLTLLFLVLVYVSVLKGSESANTMASSKSSKALPKALSRFSFQQAVNMPAIKKFFGLFSDPALVLPHISLQSLKDLPLEELKADGIKYVIVRGLIV